VECAYPLHQSVECPLRRGGLRQGQGVSRFWMESVARRPVLQRLQQGEEERGGFLRELA